MKSKKTKKKMNRIASLILALTILFGPIANVSALTVNSIDYVDVLPNSLFDIIGNVNDNIVIATTYSSAGYETYFGVLEENEETLPEADSDYDSIDRVISHYSEGYENNEDYPERPVEPEYPDDDYPDCYNDSYYTAGRTFDDLDEYVEWLEENNSACYAEYLEVENAYEEYIAAYNKYIDDYEIYLKNVIDYLVDHGENGIADELYPYISDKERFIRFFSSGSTLENNGLTLSITKSKVNDNKSIQIAYTVTNTSEVTKKYYVASTSDIDLGYNDYAAVAKVGKSGILITQDDNSSSSTYRVQLKVDFDSDVSTSWIGSYGYRFENRYTDGNVGSYTYADDVDTGLAFSWNGTLAAGESVTKTATFTIQEAPISVVKVFKKGNDTGVPDDTFETIRGGAYEIPEIVGGGVWYTSSDYSGDPYEQGSVVLLLQEELSLYEYPIITGITVSPYNGPYDGEEHDFNISGTIDGDVIVYSTDGVNYSSNMPKFTKAGTYTVYYKISRENCADYIGTLTVTINPKSIPADDIDVQISATRYDYTGNPITPEVVLKYGDEIIPSSEYTVSYVNNIEAGVATINISNAQGGNYAISAQSITFNIFDSGKLVVSDPETPNANDARITNTSQELASIIDLTDDDITANANGKNIGVYLEVVDVSDTIDESDKELIENELDDNTLGIYLDVNLFKKVEGEEAVKLTQTNAPVKITFEIPEDLLNTDNSIKRIYKVFRLHNGVVTKIDVVVNGTTATFETDEFSTYALTYIDTANNPQTGDTLPHYILMLGLSITVVVGAGLYFKKKFN